MSPIERNIFTPELFPDEILEMPGGVDLILDQVKAHFSQQEK